MLDAQRRAVNDCAGGAPIIAEFTDIESGAKKVRPGLTQALALCRARGATLLVAKLDRLSRNSWLVNDMLEAGVEFRVADNPGMTPFIARIMVAVAEEERRMIRTRIREALAEKKAQGVALGGCQGAARTRADGFTASMAAIIGEMRASGLVRASAIARELNARGIPASRGGAWQSVQVDRLLVRLDA